MEADEHGGPKAPSKSDDGLRPYDVFLSYNGTDKAEVEAIARRLRDEHGLRPFFDEWSMVPGKTWMKELSNGLKNSEAVAVFFGPEGMSAWERKEQFLALELDADRPERPVIPVLLPNGRREDVTGFLKLRTWVDLGKPHGFEKLLAGIRWQALEDVGEPEAVRSKGLPSISPWLWLLLAFMLVLLAGELGWGRWSENHEMRGSTTDAESVVVRGRTATVVQKVALTSEEKARALGNRGATTAEGDTPNDSKGITTEFSPSNVERDAAPSATSASASVPSSERLKSSVSSSSETCRYQFASGSASVTSRPSTICSNPRKVREYIQDRLQGPSSGQYEIEVWVDCRGILRLGSCRNCPQDSKNQAQANLRLMDPIGAKKVENRQPCRVTLDWY